MLSRVLRSFLTLAAGEWVARGIGVAIQIWLARQLTPVLYGIITFGIALVGWFGLVVDSGTEQLNVREISRRPERFRELADAVLGLRLALSVGAAVALGLFTYYLSTSASSSNVLPRFALVLPALALNLRWMVLGIGQARAVALGNIASRIVFLVAILALVAEPSQASRVPLLEALSEATYGLVIVILVARAYGWVRPKIDLAAWRTTMTQGFPLLVFGACRATILTIDVALIALILGHGETGLYGAALKPVAFFLGALGLFSISFLAGYSASSTEDTNVLFRRSILLGFGSMMAIAIALSAGSPLVTFVFGQHYSGAAAPLAVLAWTLPIAALSVPYTSVLVARDRQDLVMHNNIAGAVFNVAANAVAITFGGITAAAVVRFSTYALLLVLNHRMCVSRGLAPSLLSVFTRSAPRTAQRVSPPVKDVPGDYYRRLHEVDTGHWWHVGMHRIGDALLAGRLSAGGSFLDAGCGTGGFLARVRALGTFDRLCGFDVSAEAVDFARETVPEADVRVAPLDAIPFDDADFDLACSLDVLQHVPSGALEKGLRELHRVLRPGGALLVRTNGGRRARRDREDWRLFDADTLAADLRATGFVVRRVTYANTMLSFAAAALGRSPHAPTGETSGIPRPEGGVKAAVGSTLLGVEARLLASPRGHLPYGHTLFALAERESRP